MVAKHVVRNSAPRVLLLAVRVVLKREADVFLLTEQIVEEAVPPVMRCGETFHVRVVILPWGWVAP